MPRKARLYVPLDVEFFDNEKILGVGEKAGWLYLAMLCEAKRRMSDGVVTKRQLVALQVPGWQQRLATLISAGLVLETDAPDRWLIEAFLDWNLSAEQVLRGREKDRIRKDSGRNDSGTSADSRQNLVEVEGEALRSKSKRSEAEGEEARCAHGRAFRSCLSCARKTA